MGKQYDSLSPKLMQFISNQKIFFVGTAMNEGRVNISPKGMDSLRVLSPNKVIWLNVTGSGNETSIHLEHHDRMTIMFCSFDKMPMILRLYGTAKCHHRGEEGFDQFAKELPALPGARQIFELELDMVQTSCGFGVPLMNFVQERPLLRDYGAKKEENGLEQYWNTKNNQSIDGIASSKFADQS